MKQYSGYVSNEQGATADIMDTEWHNGPLTSKSIRKVIEAARQQFGRGWTVHIIEQVFDEDNNGAIELDSQGNCQEEVKTFKLRK